MRSLRIANKVLVDNEGDQILICPFDKSVCQSCCVWFGQEKDKTCDIINISCKEHFVGILSEKVKV